MDKLKNIIFSCLNFLVIVAILLFIILGLWKIGLLDVTGFVSGIFGGKNENNYENYDLKIDFLNGNEKSDYSVEPVILNSDNVKRILNDITAVGTYSQDLQYSLISNKSTLQKRVYIIKDNDIYCAYYLSGNGSVEKQIVKDENQTYVNTLEGTHLKSTAFNNGAVDFSGDTGVILTHKDFLDAADDPSYTFSISSDDNGTVMNIIFTSKMDAYSQVQEYTLNLDYGIVTEARCYENQKLIYSLSTNALSNDIYFSFTVPEQYSNFLNDFKTKN